MGRKAWVALEVQVNSSSVRSRRERLEGRKVREGWARNSGREVRLAVVPWDQEVAEVSAATVPAEAAEWLADAAAGSRAKR